MRLYAVDCKAEVEKIARVAPGSRVFCRILSDCVGAEWPLSRKFGCEPAMAADVLEHAHRLGLEAYGVSFHVGSQQRNPHAWDRALASAAAVFRECGERGINLTMVNLGGGFPTKYLKNVPTVKTYGSAIFRALRRHFGNRIPETIIEPGRGMVGNAGVIEAEVVLVSKKSEDDDVRWVYLDIGKFGGLAETMDESIRYPIRTPRDGDELAPCVLAGPTCDSADVLYEKRALRAAGQPRDRRQGADRGHRRLHGDLLLRGLQRLRAAEDVPHLSGTDGGLRWLPSVRNGRPTPRRARRCSTSPTGRPASPRRPSACAKGVGRNWRWLPPRAAASSAPCGSGRSSAGPDRPALLLGPLAVAPDRRSRGIGSTLMRHALREAARRGHGAVLLVGDAPYYGAVRLLQREDRRAVAARAVRAAPAARPRAQARRARRRARADQRPKSGASSGPILPTLVAGLVGERQPRSRRTRRDPCHLCAAGVTDVNAIAPRRPKAWPLHARFDGPIVMIGFGSIGKGTLPLIERHIAFDRSKFVVIEPDDSDRRLLDERQIRFITGR